MFLTRIDICYLGKTGILLEPMVLTMGKELSVRLSSWAGLLPLFWGPLGEASCIPGSSEITGWTWQTGGATGWILGSSWIEQGCPRWVVLLCFGRATFCILRLGKVVEVAAGLPRMNRAGDWALQICTISILPPSLPPSKMLGWTPKLGCTTSLPFKDNCGNRVASQSEEALCRALRLGGVNTHSWGLCRSRCSPNGCAYMCTYLQSREVLGRAQRLNGKLARDLKPANLFNMHPAKQCYWVIFLVGRFHWPENRATKICVLVTRRPTPLFLFNTRWSSPVGVPNVPYEVGHKWASCKISQNVHKAECLPPVLFALCRNCGLKAVLPV
jgi:hypothetical protein